MVEGTREVAVGGVGDSERELAAARAWPDSPAALADTAVHHVLKLEAVPAMVAQILKQEALAAGAEAAIDKRVLLEKVPTTDVLLMGTRAQLQVIRAKLESQPWLGLGVLARELGEALDVLGRGRPPDMDCRGRRLPLSSRTCIMGVLNVTPNAFTGDGVYGNVEAAVEKGLAMERAGAGIIDVGGESGESPDPSFVDVEEEIRRVVPVVRGLAERARAVISVDTNKTAVAEAALEAGAHMINDVCGLRADMRLAHVCARFGAPVVISHIMWKSRSERREIPLDGLLRDVTGFLRGGAALALRAGVSPGHILVDPGLGAGVAAGKTTEQNLLLLRCLGELRTLGYPVVVGPSRKAFIGTVLGLPSSQLLEGTAAAVALAVMAGAHVVRVHDVPEMVRVTRTVDAIKSGSRELKRLERVLLSSGPPAASRGEG